MKINYNNVSLKMSAGKSSQFLRNPLPQIAFSGRSNVGKSSLINTILCKKSLARVSSAPGKTITVNFYDVDGKFYLVDLPGYGYAKRTAEEQRKWSELVDGYFTNNPNIDLLKAVVQLIDSRIGPTKDDLAMIRFLNESSLPYFIVLTKTDKLSKSQKEKALLDIRSSPLIPNDKDIILFSSESKEGKDEVLQTIFHTIEE